MNTDLMVLILTHDDEFIDYGHIVGVEMVKSTVTNGWFPSLKLLTSRGEMLEGRWYMIRPYTPQLQLEYHDAVAYG